MCTRAGSVGRRPPALAIVGLLAGLLAVLVYLAATPAAARAQGPAQVAVFPIPGSRVALPGSQIVFRGIAPGQIGAVSVTGSVTGAHAGSLASDSDGAGASFLPAQPFAPGETVTVTTSLNIVGATNGTYAFTVANPARGLPPLHWPAARRVSGDTQQFHSRPDLSPVAVKVTKQAHGASPGFIFIAPQFGPMQDGPMILDSHGRLVWFKPLTGDDSAADFRVQNYFGQPVLTWWQGYVAAGVGIGRGIIYNNAYQQIAVVRAADGVSADLHEFRITPQNTALITATEPVYWDARKVHGIKRQIVFDSIVQEIDIQTGLLLFQWDSLDHIPVTDSYQPLPASAGSPFDYFHANSVDIDKDGNLVVSARNTWAVYKLDRRTGAVIWRLGGKHSSFKLAPGTYWAFQHDARVHAVGDRYVTLFDNSGGPPPVHKQSRGIKLMLDLRHMTAKEVSEHAHTPSLQANNEGNYQQLYNMNDFMGWGQQPYFDEYDSKGHLVFEASLADANSNYRAYKFGWSGAPDPSLSPPAVAAARSGKGTVVYASWNGAIHVRSWQVLGGASPTALQPVGSVTKDGFETAAKVPAEGYVAVQALDWSGHVMATSPVIAVH